METLSVISQIINQLSQSTTEQERISHLAPIEIVLLNLTEDVKIKVNENNTFLCLPALEKKEGKEDVDYDDIDYLKITDKRLLDYKKSYLS